MDFVFWFLLGFLTGVGFFVIYGAYQVDKLKKKRDGLLEDVKKKAAEMEAKTSSIRDRLTQASKLAQAQTDLRSQTEMPSKNSTHSKHKNGLITEIQNLEQQKINILKTILAEGHNPLITVVHEGGAKQEIALSEYVAAAQQVVDTYSGGSKPTAIPPSNNPDLPKQVGKFFIHKGGKPDGTVH